MKFTLAWLKDHLDTRASVAEIAEMLTRIGLEVEEVFDPATTLAPFRVAQVLKCEKHPNADKLQVCEVDTGSERLQVVCGAPNARAGLKAVFAPVGSTIPGSGLTLTKAKIRGVESNGMLLSERELELSDEHSGIIELPASAKIGSPAAKALGLDDAVIEVAITPNRPDCLGVRGIARDLAAAGLGKLKADTIKPVKGSFANPVPIKLDFDKASADACPVFAGRVVRGVKNGPSPDWLQKRLKAIGLRPINALVDITNYISYDRGRPLHVYDADKLKGAIRARLGKKGESFRALDGKSYDVDADMCVIADDKRVLGLGGVMGGEDTGATPATTNVFIESAYFDPKRTARTGTEAQHPVRRAAPIRARRRSRFRAAGTRAGHGHGARDLRRHGEQDRDGGQGAQAQRALRLRSAARQAFERARPQGGRDQAPARGARHCAHRHAAQAQGGAALLASRYFRARRSRRGSGAARGRRPGAGDAIAADCRGGAAGADRGAEARSVWCGALLAARGFVEAVTWSFIPPAEAKLFGGGQAELTLSNPISTELQVMRPSLIPGLVTAAQRNRDRGFADGALFELGQAYRGARAEDQFVAASGVRFGHSALSGSGRHWAGEAPAADVFAAKADAVAALAALGIDQASLTVTREAPNWFHPGRSGALKLGPKTVLGMFGELHPEVLAKLGAEAPLAVFELYLDALPAAKRKGVTKPALDASDLQPVARDFAFLLDRDVEAGEVVRAAFSADRALIAEVGVFDVFTGQGVPEGKKSLAIEVTLQPRDKTLTDAEIEGIAAKIVAAVQKATGGELRG